MAKLALLDCDGWGILMSDECLGPIDPELIERINREHFVVTDVRPADLLFVFGTRHGVDEFVAEAARLWRGGYYKIAIVSGGPTWSDPEPEAIVIKRGMVSAGVPQEVILTEEAAANTGENVIFSLPVLDRHYGLSRIRSLIAVGKLCASRRYLMTLERHWPGVEKMMVAVEWSGAGREDWHLHPYWRDRFISEYAKIGPYLEQGFIAPWPVKA